MKYHQKDIVEIDFPIPGEGYKVHPALIVSNDDLQVDEGFVYVALISSQAFTYSQHYAYELKDQMLTFKMEKQSYVKCQILAVTVDTGILRRLGSIKQQYFDEIVDKIVESIF